MIQVEHLTKRYGDFVAVHDLNFTIESGHIYGFLGPNGAGKSTTMNMMTGCLSATEGHVRISGYDIFDQPQEAKKRIGYLPDIPPLYLNETPAEYLHFVGEAKGLRKEALRDQVESAMEKTGLAGVVHRPIGELSKGYRQRVGIAQALLGNPEVIILDEPTVGLDPLQILEIRDLIRQLGEEHTVILSSHILSEVQALCDQILIISQGELLAFDTPENLEHQMRAASEVSLTAEVDAAQVSAILEDIPQVASFRITDAQPGVTCATAGTAGEDARELSKAIFEAFAQKGMALLELRLEKASLEEIFLELTEKDAHMEVEA